MKKQYLLLLILFCSLILPAQNWSVFNASYRYNYSLENEAYTTTVIFADSSLTSGPNQVFSLNRIVTKCDTCHQAFWNEPGSTDTSYWLSNQPQFLQRRIIYSGQDFRLSDTNNYIIKHLAPVGSPWTFNTTYSITAQIQSKIQKNVFGIPDSVAIILLSTADTILLSKQFGFIKYPAEFGHQTYYKLRGIENKTGYAAAALYGEKVPNYYDIFKLKVGSKQYYSTQESYSGDINTCPSTLYGIKTILSSSVSGTVITTATRDQKIGCPTTSHPTCPRASGGCDPIFIHNNLSNPYVNINALETNTVQGATVINDIDSIYNKGYNNKLYFDYSSGYYAVVKFGMTSNMHFFKTYGASCFSKNIKDYPLTQGMYETVSLMHTNHPNVFYFGSPIAKGMTYIEGYGRVDYCNIDFEYYYAYCTSIIVDGSDSIGSTSTITMGLNELVANDGINRVYPNPVKYNLTVAVPYEVQTNGNIILTDALGNTVKTIKTTGEETQQLNIEPYSDGIYFLKIESSGYLRTYKIIKN